MKNLSKHIKLTMVSGPVVAGTSTITPPSGVDMQGFQGVIFVAFFGTLSAGAVTVLKAQTSADNGSVDTYADLLGSHINIAQASGSNQALVLDVYRPIERWVLPIVTRSTGNAVLNAIVAIQYGPFAIPTTQDVTTIAGSLFLPDSTPAGTA